MMGKCILRFTRIGYYSASGCLWYCSRINDFSRHALLFGILLALEANSFSRLNRYLDYLSYWYGGSTVLRSGLFHCVSYGSRSIRRSAAFIMSFSRSRHTKNGCSVPPDESRFSTSWLYTFCWIRNTTVF